jgi:hypothetical protein
MSSRSGDAEGKFTRIRPNARAMISAIRALRRSHREQDLDEESPAHVLLSGHASKILERAQELAGEDREDREAVGDLSDLAGRDQQALREAALGARQWGAHHDHRNANLAHRLLQAAINDRPVSVPTEPERERFALLDEFVDLPIDAAWDRLTSREPRLAGLEHEVRAGLFSGKHGATELHALPQDEARRVAMDLQVKRRELNGRLRTLVGPESDQGDQLLGSFAASQVAVNYLADLSDKHAHR